MTTHVPANVSTSQPVPFSLAIMDPAQFEHMQRVGKMLALSPLFPEHLRKGGLETAIANGVLVINMAMRLREDPLTVAQNIYFVGGKPGWMTTYLIAKANQHGVFDGPIEWKVEGKGETLSVTAYATLSRNGRTVSVTCDMALAKAEGWTSNKKYQTMPEQMLRYRSATWLVRLYCPEVLVGVPAAIDHDLPMRDVTPEDTIVATRSRSEIAGDDAPGAVIEQSQSPHDPETGEVTEPQTIEKPKPETVVKPAKETAPAKAASSAQAEPAPAEVKAQPLAADRYVNLRAAILRDLDQSGDTVGVMGFYAEVLEDMAVNAPDMLAEIKAKVAEMEGA